MTRSTHSRGNTPALATAALSALALLAGCKTERNQPADTTRGAGASASASSAGAASMAQRVGATEQMKTPESVRYDPDLDVYFVSNVNGNPSVHDGNGFIVRIPAESTTTVTTLVESGRNGATLDAPKGIAILGNNLWVADIDVVRVIDKKTGKLVKTVSLKGNKATFLNDVCVGGDGNVYVTDTGIAFDAKGGMSHPGTNRIFRITPSYQVSEAATGDSLESPNGITWDAAKARFLLAPFAGKDVQTWKPGDKAPARLVDGPGQYDGIEVLQDGRILVSSWADSSVNVVQNGKLTRLVGNVSAPADIGVDTKRHILAIPRFNDGKVEYYRIP